MKKKSKLTRIIDRLDYIYWEIESINQNLVYLIDHLFDNSSDDRFNETTAKALEELRGSKKNEENSN